MASKLRAHVDCDVEERADGRLGATGTVIAGDPGDAASIGSNRMPPTATFSRESREATTIRWGRTILTGVGAGIAILAGTFLVLTPLLSVARVLSEPARPWLAVGLLGAVAFLVGLGLGWWRARPGTAAAIVAGLTAALLLFVSRLLLRSADQSFNELFFGWPGMLVAIILAPLGARLGEGLSDRLTWPHTEAGALARVGLLLAAAWVITELSVRTFGALVLGGALDNLLAGDMLAVLVGFPAMAYFVARYGLRHGLSSASWDYRWGAREVGLGLVTGLAMYGLTFVTGPIDQVHSGSGDALPAHFRAGLQDGAWVAALLLLVNCLVVPACEELAWRATIQTSLVAAWGVAPGLLVTALLFALKHVLVDGSLARVTTLLMFAAVVGLVRHRWGTGSSTTAHWTAKLIATTSVIVVAG
jgi:membrane protease YdiL (CAAX protease family)